MAEKEVDPRVIKKAQRLRNKAAKQRTREISEGRMDDARDSSAAVKILNHFLRRNG